MIVDLSTGDETEPELTPKQKAGQLGGLKGGKARAEKLTPEERSAIAKKAAEKRWKGQAAFFIRRDLISFMAASSAKSASKLKLI